MAKNIKQSKQSTLKKNKGSNVWNLITQYQYAFLIIAVLSVFVYMKSFSHNFVDFDDSNIIKNLENLNNEVSVFDAFNRDAFVSTAGDVFYRPMQGLTYMIDFAIGGNKPLIYHITNLLLHILTCFSLFYLLSLLKLEKRSSLIFSLLYSVHPLFSLTVSWVPSRGDLLIGLFGLLTLITFIKFFEEKSWLYFGLHVLTFFISAFSKESTLVFPLIFVMLFYFKYYNKDEKNIFTIENIALFVSWVTIILFYLIMRASVIKVALKPGQIGFMTFLGNIWTIPEFIAKFFIPVSLNGIPQYTTLVSSIGIIIIIALVGYTIYNKSKFNYLSGIGLIWFFVFTATTMMFRHEHFQNAYDYLEHRTYLPMIGILIYILSFMSDFNRTKALVYSIIPIIFLFSVYTFTMTSKYKDPDSFYTSVIDAGSNVALAYYNRGVNRQNTGNIKGAIEDYDTAIRIKANYAQAYNNRGNIYRDQKKYEQALADYTKAIESKADFGEAYSNRGVAYKETNKRNEAMADYQTAIKLNPKYSGSYNNIGVVYGTEANYPESIKYFNKAVELDKKFAEAYKNRGLSYLLSGNRSKACDDFSTAMQLGSAGGKNLFNSNCAQKMNAPNDRQQAVPQ